jgi:F-type H+-transporting ATPase subunit delta
MTAFARSYAQAFLGAAASGYNFESFLVSAEEIHRAIGSDGRLKAFFASPAVPLSAKKGALAELSRAAGVDAYGSRLLDLALEKGRLPALAEILSAIREQADRASGVVAARVSVAAPVGDAERGKIADGLARVVGKRVRLEVELDEKILGGFVAKVGSEVFDASVRGAIERFREQTKEGAGT